MVKEGLNDVVEGVDSVDEGIHNRRDEVEDIDIVDRIDDPVPKNKGDKEEGS